jgi:glycerol-3-phosphate acyltransferase PlsY
LFALLVILPALVTDYIVSGSLTSFIGLPVVSYLHHYPVVILIFSLGLTALCFYLHRNNLRRIMAGEELKIRSVLFKKS